MKNSKLLTVINLAFLVSLVGILKVIIGLVNNPPGFTYLAVGHYYMDYFEYLQQTAQGMMGHWAVLNQFATDDPTRTILGWGQYLIIGKIAKILHLSVVSGYWLAVFFLIFAFCLSIYFIIRRLLPKLSFFYQMIAWFFCLFAAPFFKIIVENGINKVIPFDFWYAPMSFFHRFGGVPHHLLTGILTVVILIQVSEIFDRLKTEKPINLKWKISLLIFLLASLLTFAPLQVVNLVSAILALSLISVINKLRINRIIILNILIVLFILPIGLVIKISHDGSGLFQRAIAWESTQQNYPDLLSILLTTGPIFIFSLIGLRRYFKDISNLKLILFFYVVMSYVYFFTPLARFFGTFNGRFLSPSIYILFGTLAILGIEEVAHWFGSQKKLLMTVLIGLLSAYFIWMTVTIFISFGPVDQTSYLPNPIYNGLKFLGDRPEKKAVLTSPDKYLGMIVPVFADKNVYIARPIFTPDFENKLNIADQFYQGNMKATEAQLFLKNNRIGFVLLTFMEKYSPDNLKKYSFLKIIYDKEGVKIYQVL